jgi:hypothetical protein
MAAVASSPAGCEASPRIRILNNPSQVSVGYLSLVAELDAQPQRDPELNNMCEANRVLTQSRPCKYSAFGAP